MYPATAHKGWKLRGTNLAIADCFQFAFRQDEPQVALEDLLVERVPIVSAAAQVCYRLADEIRYNARNVWGVAEARD